MNRHPAAIRSFRARSRITSLADPDTLIQELQKLRGELRYAHAFELKLRVGQNAAREASNRRSLRLVKSSAVVYSLLAEGGNDWMVDDRLGSRHKVRG